MVLVQDELKRGLAEADGLIHSRAQCDNSGSHSKSCEDNSNTVLVLFDFGIA